MGAQGRPAPQRLHSSGKLEQQAGLGPSLTDGTVWRAAGETDTHLESGEADRFPETMSQSPELCGVSGTKTDGMGSCEEQAEASCPLSWDGSRGWSFESTGRSSRGHLGEAAI